MCNDIKSKRKLHQIHQHWINKTATISTLIHYVGVNNCRQKFSKSDATAQCGDFVESVTGVNYSELDAWQCAAWWPPVGCCYLANAIVNASPLNYGRWVGQNSVPICSRLWTNIHQIRPKFACVGVSVVCNAVFRLTMLRSGDIRDQVAKLSEIASKFHVLGRHIAGGRGPQISDRIS